eukprot:491503_1
MYAHFAQPKEFFELLFGLIENSYKGKHVYLPGATVNCKISDMNGYYKFKVSLFKSKQYEQEQNIYVVAINLIEGNRFKFSKFKAKFCQDGAQIFNGLPQSVLTKRGTLEFADIDNADSKVNDVQIAQHEENSFAALLPTNDLEQIDFEIFFSKSMNCIELNDTNDMISRCEPLQRLCVALKYYELLVGAASYKTNQDIADTFVIFAQLYHNFLDDWYHFIENHTTTKQLIQIADTLIKNYGLQKCNIIKCNKIHRHYRRNNQVKNNSEDGIFEFYVDCYDRFHHYIFHLFQMGLRVAPTDEIMNNSKNDDVDLVFQQTRDLIRSIKKQNGFDLERYNEENNKFNIKIDGEQNLVERTGTDDITFLDEVFLYFELVANIARDDISVFRSYTVDNEYDTDAIKADLDKEITDSNLYNNILNPVIRKHIKILHFASKEFSTGFIFFYGENAEYKTHEMTGDLLNGYSQSELLICAHFKSLKQEIMESGFLTLQQWNQNVVLKGNQYHQTKKAGNMSSPNIYSIILYCDWSDLCTSFSSTFRKKHAFETIQSLEKRHSKYYHFAKTLENTVNSFGIHGGNFSENENGPFYCGISMVLNIPSFAIYLKGPCSTSKDAEVAINFAKRDGIIIQLQNDKGFSFKQTFFDCSPISQFAEENERLFIAGRYRLRISSIKIVETAECFEEYMHAFYMFDAMISDVDPVGISSDDILKSDKLILNALINGGSEKMRNIHIYMLNTFHLFLNTKTNIEINIHFLATRFAKLSQLFMHSIHDTSTVNDNASKNNLLNAATFNVFPNLKQVVINTTYKDFTYKLDLLSFLSSIETAKSSINIIKSQRVEKSKESWCSNILSTNNIKKWKTWIVNYAKEEHRDDHSHYAITDCLVIYEQV